MTYFRKQVQFYVILNNLLQIFPEIDSGRKNRNDEGFSNLANISHIQLKDDLQYLREVTLHVIDKECIHV